MGNTIINSIDNKVMIVENGSISRSMRSTDAARQGRAVDVSQLSSVISPARNRQGIHHAPLTGILTLVQRTFTNSETKHPLTRIEFAVWSAKLRVIFAKNRCQHLGGTDLCQSQTFHKQ